MESPPAPWEQQPGERDQPFRRFRAWLDLGPDRSLSAFGAAQGISRQAAYQQAKRWDWAARARAWDAAQSPGGYPPPPAPKQRPPARPQAPQEPPQPEPPNLLNTMAAELSDQEHQLQEAREFVEAFRRAGRSFVRESERALELLGIMQECFRLEVERHRQLMEEKQYQAAADLAKSMNTTAFMVVRFSTTATTLAAAGRLHWGDSCALLELIQKGYGEGV